MRSYREKGPGECSTSEKLLGALKSTVHFINHMNLDMISHYETGPLHSSVSMASKHGFQMLSNMLQMLCSKAKKSLLRVKTFSEAWNQRLPPAFPSSD